MNAWIWVGAWCGVIYATIPFARMLQKHVAASSLGSAAFQYFVITFLGIAAVALLIKLRRDRLPLSRCVWLLLTGGVFIYYTLQLNRSPEEAVHFAEYGVLSVLIFRALRRSIDDVSIYFTAAIIGGTAGVADELIQAITPKRVWDLRDIGLNFFAVALTQVGLVLVLRPPLSNKITARGLRWFCRAAVLGVLLLGASMVPLVEYGYFYDDAEIGSFRSRFNREELAATDTQRCADAAKILDQYPRGEHYGDFLKNYPPEIDPFVHEMRVHLFRRDHYAPRDPAIAFRENQILEKYFPETLHRSTLSWTATKTAEIQRKAVFDQTYESPVSEGLFTVIRRPTLIAALILLLLALAVADRLATKLP